jgi:hypothetical protein
MLGARVGARDGDLVGFRVGALDGALVGVMVATGGRGTSDMSLLSTSTSMSYRTIDE